MPISMDVPIAAEHLQVNTTNFILSVTEEGGALKVFAYRKNKRGEAIKTKTFVLGISALVYYTKGHPAG